MIEAGTDISEPMQAEENYFNKSIQQVNEKLFKPFIFESDNKKTWTHIVALLKEYYGYKVRVKKAWFSNKIKISFEVGSK